MVACLGIWLSLVEIWVSLVIWVPLFLGLPGVQGPASPVAIWACCPLRHARLVPGHLPTTGIMPLHVRHTNTTTVMGHGLSLLMHRIAQIVDGKLDTAPLCSLGWQQLWQKGHGFLAGERWRSRTQCSRDWSSILKRKLGWVRQNCCHWSSILQGKLTPSWLTDRPQVWFQLIRKLGHIAWEEKKVKLCGSERIKRFPGNKFGNHWVWD